MKTEGYIIVFDGITFYIIKKNTLKNQEDDIEVICESNNLKELTKVCNKMNKS